ncbi:iron ABC transporter permease [Litorivicinus sp.]|jgi:iron(III) transport system permease protein|nr:iron ABC transporter permease [Litorivicinus sp.]MDC1319078.1 iron ABC transporter permease [Litorivicinus sp.]
MRTIYNRFRIGLTPQRVLSVVFLIALGYLVIFPLFLMAKETFIVHPLERFQIPGSSIGDLTLSHWIRSFVSENSFTFFYRPLLNTLQIAFGLSFLALLIGGTLAWLVVRTDIPMKNIITNAAIIPYIMPSWTLALAWIALFKNERIGGDQGIFTALTGVSTPDWFAYGLFPITITLALHYFPFGFMLIGGALRNIDAQLEESAELLGASRMATLRRIVIPLVLPAIFSTFLLTFSRGLGTFGTPAFLGGPVREFVLSTSLYANLIGGRPGIGYLAALAMIVLGVLVLYMDHKIIGTRRSYVTISGKGARAGLVALGRWRWPIASLLMGSILAVIVVPLGALAIDTFMLRPGLYSWENFTWHYWIGEASLSVGLGTGEPGILRNPELMSALGNTMKLAVVVALITGILGVLVGYAIVRMRGSWVSQALDQLSFLPYLMPSIALGAIFLAMFAVPRWPFPSLHGTFTLLVIACVVSYLPYAVKAGVSAIRQIGPELEEAAIMTGASWWTRMHRVIIPIQKSTYFSGLLLPFISVTRELSLLILLVTPTAQLATTITLRYTDRGWYPYTNGMVLLLVVIVVTCTIMSRRLMGTNIAKGLGG